MSKKKLGPDKIPAVRVPSDDCAVPAGGKTFFPHRGEWVEVIPGASMGEKLGASRLMLLYAELEAGGLSEEQAKSKLVALDAVMGELCASVASRLVAWSWTDRRGQPLPPPDEAVIRGLHAVEIGYLLKVGGD